MFDPHHLSRYCSIWSAEDGAFVVEVPDLPGGMADGPTQEAAQWPTPPMVIREWMDVARRSWAGPFRRRARACKLPPSGFNSIFL